MVFLTFIGFLSFNSAKLWGNDFLLAQVWANEHPTSMRAQTFAAEQWIETGDLDKAINHFKAIQKFHPDEISAHTSLLLLQCSQGYPISKSQLNVLEKLHATGKFSNNVLQHLTYIRKNMATICPSINAQHLKRFIAMLLSNPNYHQFPEIKHYIVYEKGLLGMQLRELDYAMQGLDQAYQIRPDPEIAIQQASILASAGLYDHALRYLNLARDTQISDWKKFINNNDDRINTLEQKIRIDQKFLPEKSP